MTGATGFLGSHLTGLLVRRGDEVRALVSPASDPTPVAGLDVATSSAKAKRELGWRTSPHEDCLEETIAWYRHRDGARLSPPGARQPVALRVAGTFVRRSPLGWL